MNPFADRLHRGPLILNGGTGTLLVARGLRPAPGLWTALAPLAAPDLLRGIHADYVAAGAELLTANTFRVTAAALRTATWLPRRLRSPAGLRRLARAALALCRQAAGDHALVAASLAPLADCYHPEATPPDAILRRAHQRTARALASLNPDVLLCETLGHAREALRLTDAAVATGRPTLVSFLVAADGRRLLGGEPLLPTARACVDAGAAAILVNCADLDTSERALSTLAALARVPLGAYPNAARLIFAGRTPTWEPDPRPLPERAAAFAERTARWLRQGLAMVGGCCGTEPAYIAALRDTLGR